MFKLRHLQFNKKYQLILNFTNATSLKNVGRGHKKAGKVSVTKKKHLEEPFATNYVKWQQKREWVS